ncbi:MAG TPA: patatin-like phospholipase family protein [Phycisphaerales bacterium]|nr:patatin-like phospholipase family protein [Phycisphaerales bacterium]HMP37398.1 patatin-like phospholipase family protein [Phycisphaerales bacterium]
MTRHAVALVGLLLVVVQPWLGGCARRIIPPSLAELEEREIEYLAGIIRQQDRIIETMILRMEMEARRAAESGNPEEAIVDVLVLSGGGEKGAFGAAFLKAWGEVEEPGLRRPEFDIVTGVSTGSLIAPFAFIGTDEAYEVADSIYRNPRSDWVRKRSFLEVLLVQDSIFDDAGLLRTIEEVIAPRAGEIAAGLDEHRLLLIGATNLNQGMSSVWNLTELAAKVQRGEMSVEEFSRHNLSSASIPVAFPPQLLGGNLYVDGSTTRDILYLSPFDSTGELVARWRERNPGVRLPRMRIWVIANTAIIVPPVAVDPRDLPVLGRSLTLAIDQGLISQLRILEIETKLLALLHEQQVEFRYVSLPDGFEPAGSGMFNKSDMDRMADIGRAMGKDPRSWRSHVPDPMKPTALRAELERRRAGRQAATEAAQRDEGGPSPTGDPRN